MTLNALPEFTRPATSQDYDALANAFYETGVVILRQFVAVDDCDRLAARIAELVDAFDPYSVRHVFSTHTQAQVNDAYFLESGDKIRFFLEDEAFDENDRLRQSKQASLNKMGHAMHDLDPEFDRFSRRPELKRLAQALGIEHPAIIQSMVIFKPPRIGGEVTCHQDSTFIYTEPQSCVGFWFALEDATLDNGCMQFSPGRHSLKARHFRQPDGQFRTVELEADGNAEQTLLPAPANKGDLVIFSGTTPHLSGPNRSDRSRMAYTLHAIDGNAEYPADNWLQRSPGLPLRGFDAAEAP